jgi:ATP-dependent helicase/nuclease subunit A
VAADKQPVVADAQLRADALAAEQSFIVQAPAGSGKTELLTQRFLKMLSRVDNPEEVLAITFTRKAAAEMRARIINAIFPPSADSNRLPETIVLAEAVLAQNQNKDWHLQDNPARLRIQTIDSVNTWLSSTAPLSSGAGAAANRITESPADYYREAAQECLEFAATDDTAGAAVRDLLKHLDNRSDTFIRLFTDMLASREQWLGFVVDLDAAGEGSEQARKVLEDCLNDVVTAELEVAAKLLNVPQRRRILERLQFAAQNLCAANPESEWHYWTEAPDFPSTDAEHLHAWQLVTEFLLKKDSQPRLSLNKNNGFPPGKGANKEQKEAALELIAEIGSQSETVLAFAALRGLPEPVYSDSQWEMLRALFTVLRLAAAQLSVVFRERSVTDYPAVARAAIDALNSATGPTDLALRLDYTVAHILIDEFQDTSTAQLKLLQQLTAGWQPDDGRTLFIVGDPMQSIYRFRQAEVGLFLELQRDGLENIELKPLTLQTNFRSDPEIVEWVNSTFSQIMPATSDVTRGAVGYAPGTPIRAKNSASGVTAHPFAWPSRYDETQAIVELIQTTLEQWPDKNIGVLVRGKAHASLLVDALRDKNIEFSGTGLENTLETTVIQDLLCLTRALSHPADRTAWLGLLRAPWCGLTLADLEALAGTDVKICIWDLVNDTSVYERLSAEGAERLARVRTILMPVFARRGALSLRDLVEGVWLQLGGPAFLHETIDMDRAQSFFAALDQVDAGGDCADAFDLHLRIAAQLSVEDREARVNIMTIHKAKGLEFDTVILPALEAAVRGDSKPPLAWQEIVRSNGEPGLIIAPIEATGEASDPIFELARRQNKQRAQFEAERLLYVATTRARERLHLFFGLSSDDEGVKAPVKNSLLARLWPAIEKDYTDFAQPQGTAVKLDAWVSPSLRRYQQGWTVPQMPEPFATLDTEPAQTEPADITFDWAGSTARHIGSVTHRWLQFLAEHNLQQWTTADISARQTSIELMLTELGVASHATTNASAKVTAALANAIQAERGRWLLFAEHSDPSCELQLSAHMGQQTERYIVDRSFISEGERWIIDYKTSSHSGGNLDAFIDSEAERYTPQLKKYAAVFRRLEPDTPQRAALYFPLLDVFKEIPV